jgi:phage terminase large subunit-like protein
MKSLTERLLDYCYKILNGEIKACKKHKQAVERFLNDVNRIPDDDFEYYFDGEELEDFYEWSCMFRHTKGVLATSDDPYIKLTDFQLFLCANILCWKEKKSHLRRIRKVFIQLARKNAKTQIMALIASYIAFLSDEQEEIYIGATTREQSQILYNELLSQIGAVDDLKGRYKDSYGRITTNRTRSVIQALSKEARKSGDGKNPSVGIIDEYHQHPDDGIYETLKTGMVARSQPLLMVITTAGMDLESPCMREYNYVSKIIDPESVVENDQYFVLICELDEGDDIKDESNWIKANPIVATYEAGMKSIRDDLKIALEVEEKMIAFLTKNMNLWVQMKPGGYMNLAKWNRCGLVGRKLDKMPDTRGKEIYIGVDLSSTLDLTSVAFTIPIGNEEYVVYSHSFMPEERLKEKMATDNVPYQTWVRQGWITLTDGDVVDYDYVEKYILDRVEEEGWICKVLCYDEWNATQFANAMIDNGYSAVKVIQGMKTLAPGTKEFRDSVYKQKVYHDDNPVLNWALGNAIKREDHNENFMLDKKASSNRIDPAAAIMTAHAHARFAYGMGDLNEGLSDDYLDKLGW